jgi:hypothetical protein
MVVNNRGQLVEREGVNQFGAELRAEQSHEAPPDPIATALAAAHAAAKASSDVANYEQVEEPLVGGVNPMLSSGQIPASHEVGSGLNYADPNHRLPAPKSPVQNALTNPLLWIGVVILILAFFVAAFV